MSIGYYLIISLLTLLVNKSQGQNRLPGSESQPKSNTFLCQSPYIELTYSDEWRVSNDFSEESSGSEIKPEILLSLRTEPTAEVPSVATMFMLALDTSYNATIIVNEEQYLEYIKLQMSKEFPYLFEEKINTKKIAGKSFKSLSGYASMMGYFIQIEYLVFKQEGTYILITNVYDNKSDKMRLDKLVKSLKLK